MNMEVLEWGQFAVCSEQSHSVQATGEIGPE